jgi:ABC-type nitrate/sulfonate/bicarbonate transport system substrate-binding protein
MITRRSIVAGLALMSAALVSAPSQAQPLQIRFGYGSAAEEPLWLLIAKPELGKNYGKAYTLEATRFPAVDKRTQAFEAGAIDLASSSANGVIFAAAEGVKMKTIASLSKESTKGFTTIFAVLDSSPIKGPQDLKGKTIGISGYSGAGHLWSKVYLESKGLKESDVNLVPIRFPAMAEALKAGKVDVGMFPQPFAAMVQKEMKVRKIYTAKDAAPFEEELIVITAKEEFLKKNEAAVKAFLSDLKDATKFYNEKTKEARQILLDKRLVGIAPEIYLDLEDYYHEPSLQVSAEALEKMQDLQFKAGFQKTRADIKSLVDNSYLPQ